MDFFNSTAYLYIKYAVRCDSNSQLEDVSVSK